VELHPLPEKYSELILAHMLKATKGRFNLFTVLLEINDEVRLHTRYLAHLLDPEDHEFPGPQHDCGALFLNAFLNELAKGVVDHTGKTIVLQQLKNIDPTKVKVTPEFHTGCKGHIDLLIQCGRWALAIETKIDAAEQPNQIGDYADYLETVYPGHWILLYLTRDGKEATTAKGRPYYRISYKNTILPWLEECSRETYAYVNINQALQQYTQVVRELTGVKKEQDMSPIINVVRKHPSVIRDLDDIIQAAKELKEEMRTQFVVEISKALTRREGHYDLMLPPVNQSWVIHRHGSPVAINKCNVFLKCDDPCPYFWIAVWPTNENEWPSEVELTSLCDALKKEFPQDLQGVELNKRVSRNGSFRGGWCYLPAPKLSNAGLSDLLLKQASNAGDITSTANQIAEDIVSFIRVIEKTWSTP
jgi:hypothetical protein